MANTAILIKRSTNQAKPSSLLAGELGYSYLSNTIFIGTPDGNGVINIGGVYYTSQIDNATDAATAGALVKRDGSGNASFNTVYGSLGTASGVSAGSYGSTTEIPVVTVAANGIVTNVTTASISTSFNIAGDTGTGTVAGGETLTVAGRDGISTVAVDANNTVLIDVDNTVIRTTGGQTINGDLAITGNVIISGNTITQDVETVVTEDPLIKLAANNVADSVDIGFYGQYVNSGTKYAGLIRDHSDGNFKLFVGETTDPITNDVSYDSSNRATLDANITGGTVSGLSAAVAIADGGTNATSFTTNQRLYYNGTSFASLANNTTTVTGGLAAGNTITSITVDDYGQITGYTGGEISIDAGQISSGTLGVTRGGTGASSFTNGSIVVGSGSGALTVLANSTYISTGETISPNTTINSVTVDDYGRLTGIDFGYISGLLVPQGGTGRTDFITNGIVFGNSSGALQVTNAAGSSDQGWSNQILTTTNSGVPVWSTTLDGGQF